MLITTGELRNMQAAATMMAGHAKGVYEKINATQQVLPPSELALCSIAINMSVLAAAAIKRIERDERENCAKEEKTAEQSISSLVT